METKYHNTEKKATEVITKIIGDDRVIELIQRKIELKEELKDIDKQLKPLEDKIKSVVPITGIDISNGLLRVQVTAEKPTLKVKAKSEIEKMKPSIQKAVLTNGYTSQRLTIKQVYEETNQELAHLL